MACKMTQEERQQVAEALYEADKNHTTIKKVSNMYPHMTVEDSYDIQQIGLKLRQADGHIVVGRKIGLTSKGMMQQFGCDSPDYGYLLDSMVIPEGEPCRMSEVTLPRVEGEIAFIMGQDVKGPGVTVADIYNATAWVVPCFEVCATRIENWDVTVRDTISDIAGAGRFVLGSQPKPISEVNLRCVGMVIEKNGKLVDSAAGAEVMGNPVNSMVWLVNKLAEFDTGLKAGDIVLSGAFMASLPSVAGDIYSLSVDGFPSLTLRFE